MESEWRLLVYRHLPCTVIDHATILLDGELEEWTFDFSQLQLRMTVDTNSCYQNGGTVLETRIVDLGMQIPRKKLDQLRLETRELLYQSGEVRVFDRAIIILQALENISAADISFKKNASAGLSGAPEAPPAWDATGLNSWDQLLTNPTGVDASTIKDTASDYLGYTPTEIREMIPSRLRVIHIESIMRRDLAVRWSQYRKMLRERLSEIPQEELYDRLPPHSEFTGHKAFRIHHTSTSSHASILREAPMIMRRPRPAKDKTHPKLNVMEMTPGDKKREAAKKKAAAMKHFPFGFGPATGTQFVIEEIGEVSDDEEEYGEWQKDKHVFHSKVVAYDEKASREVEEYDEDGNLVMSSGRRCLMDQYQHAVVANSNRAKFKDVVLDGGD